jgi:hypothetical protein
MLKCLPIKTLLKRVIRRTGKEVKNHMRKTIALFVSMAFLLGTSGFAVAQTSTPAPAPAQAEKKAEEKPMQKKSHAKKMTMEERKAACLQKAGTDEAKKAKCEKQFTAKTAKKAPAAGQMPAQTGEKEKK